MKINYISTESGDWCSIYIDGEQQFEGHSIPVHTWLTLIESFVPGSSAVQAEIPDEALEEYGFTFPEFYWEIEQHEKVKYHE